MIVELKSTVSWARVLENVFNLLGKFWATVGEGDVARTMLKTTSSHDTKSLARCGVPKKSYVENSEIRYCRHDFEHSDLQSCAYYW